MLIEAIFQLELLKDRLVEGAKVLDVGCGSGYLTACMAIMAGKTGRVVGIDHYPELIELSRRNIDRDNPGLLASGRVKLVGKRALLAARDSTRKRLLRSHQIRSGMRYR